jgi:hypothetical protein
MFSENRKESKTFSSCSRITNFLPITWFCNLSSLKPLQNTSKFPTLPKISNNVSTRSQFFNVWYRWWASRIHSKSWYVAVNRKLYHNNHNGTYMFPLQISHHQAVYVRGNDIPVIHILLIIIGRYLRVTYNGIWLLHVKKCTQYKSNV